MNTYSNSSIPVTRKLNLRWLRREPSHIYATVIQKFVGMIFCSTLLGACANLSGKVEYQSLDDAPISDEKKFYQPETVWYKFHPAYDQYLPNCVVVMPNHDASINDKKRLDTVSRAIAAQAFKKFNRVIPAHEVIKARHTQGLDDKRVENKEANLKALLEHLNCQTRIEWQPWHGEAQDYMVWTEQRFGLELSLIQQDVGVDHLLWQAKHSTNRDSGTLPLGPVSLVTGAVESLSIRDNEDVFASIVDDGLRRIFATLPNME